MRYSQNNNKSLEDFFIEIFYTYIVALPSNELKRTKRTRPTFVLPAYIYSHIRLIYLYTLARERESSSNAPFVAKTMTKRERSLRTVALTDVSYIFTKRYRTKYIHSSFTHSAFSRKARQTRLSLSLFFLTAYIYGIHTYILKAQVSS